MIALPSIIPSNQAPAIDVCCLVEEVDFFLLHRSKMKPVGHALLQNHLCFSIIHTKNGNPNPVITAREPNTIDDVTAISGLQAGISLPNQAK